jgi:hypothetical protein
LPGVLGEPGHEVSAGASAARSALGAALGFDPCERVGVGLRSSAQSFVAHVDALFADHGGDAVMTPGWSSRVRRSRTRRGANSTIDCSSTNQPGRLVPFAPPALPGFTATTSRSALAPRIATLALAVAAAWTSRSRRPTAGHHRATGQPPIETQVQTFRTRAQTTLAPSPCRTPPGSQQAPPSLFPGHRASPGSNAIFRLFRRSGRDPRSRRRPRADNDCGAARHRRVFIRFV